MCDQLKIDQHDFLALQCEEMRKHKWIESEKAGYDLGDKCLLEWIKYHAAQFRREYYQNRQIEEES